MDSSIVVPVLVVLIVIGIGLILNNFRDSFLSKKLQATEETLERLVERVEVLEGK